MFYEFLLLKLGKDVFLALSLDKTVNSVMNCNLGLLWLLLS